MKNYFTFLLVSSDWGHIEETVLPVVEKLLDVVPSSRKVQATAQLKSQSGTPQIVSGPYDRARRKFEPQDLVQLILQAVGNTPGVLEFFLLFENVRYRPTPEYLRFIFPRMAERIEDAEALKIFSFSLKAELFERGLRETQRSPLLETIEKLFIAANCVYGFGNQTMWPVSGPFQFVRDNSPQAGQRIVDFDYATQIEDVYRYNYLSESHLQRIADVEEMCAAVECKRLDGGLAVYLKDAAAEHYARNYLRSLIPAAGTVPRSFQLLLPGLADTAVQRLNEYSFTRSVKELPDFTSVTLTEPASVIDNQQFYAGLNAFYESWRPLRGQSVAQLTVQYPGLFEPGLIFQRIPVRRFERAAKDDDHVKVYSASSVQREHLKLLFLLNANKRYEEVGELVREWLAAVDRRPDAYGAVVTLEEFKPFEIEGQVHGQLTIDASRLQQHGLNLLVLLLDELNRKDLIVRYLVFGELLPR